MTLDLFLVFIILIETMFTSVSPYCEINRKMDETKMP
jgi:hypothetical protein